MIYIHIRLILVVTKNLKIIHQPVAGISVHEVGKYGNSHGQLDPTLCMREVVQALNRVPGCAKRPVFHPDNFFCEKEIFFPSIWVTSKVSKTSWEEFYHLHLH